MHKNNHIDKATRLSFSNYLLTIYFIFTCTKIKYIRVQYNHNKLIFWKLATIDRYSLGPLALCHHLSVVLPFSIFLV